MFNKVGVSKFLLCAFSAGFGANLVGHATVGSENIKNTEGDAQKDSNIYVEKVSGEPEKNFIYIGADEENSNDDSESSSKESKEDIKKFMKKVCGNGSSKVRKIVFGTSLGVSSIYSIIRDYMYSPSANAAGALKALEEKGISVKFLDDEDNEIPVEEENKNTAESESEKKTDVVNSDDGKDSSKETNDDVDNDQDLNTAVGQTEKSEPSDTLNQDVKNSEKDQIVNIGWKEELSGVSLFVIFVIAFVTCYICRKKKMAIVSSPGQDKEKSIFLYYHTNNVESGPTAEERKEDKQGYDISKLMSKASTTAITRLTISDDSVLSLTGIWFKMRIGDFFDYCKSFDEKDKLKNEHFQDILLYNSSLPKHVFLYVDNMSGTNLHFKVTVDNGCDLKGKYDFYASLNAQSEAYKNLSNVLTKPDSGGSLFPGFSENTSNNNIFSN